MKQFLLAVAATVGLIVPASAQQVSQDTCVALAQTLGVGYTTSFSKKQFDALKYYANCEARDSNSSGGLKIGYSAFSLGAEYSQAEKSNICSKSFDKVDIDALDYSFVKSIFEPALDTINKCIDAAKRGWIISYQRLLKDSVTLNVSNSSGTGGSLLAINVIPPNSLSCTPALPSVPIIVKSTEPFATTCSRTPQSQMIDGVSVTSAPDVVLNVQMSEGPLPIKLDGYSSSILEAINKKIEAAKAETAKQVADLSAALGSWGEDKPGNAVNINGGYGPITSKCPDGYYAMGVTNWGNSSGPYCIGCFVQSQVLCKKLKTK